MKTALIAPLINLIGTHINFVTNTQSDMNTEDQYHSIDGNIRSFYLVYTVRDTTTILAVKSLLNPHVTTTPSLPHACACIFSIALRSFLPAVIHVFLQGRNPGLRVGPLRALCSHVHLPGRLRRQ